MLEKGGRKPVFVAELEQHAMFPRRFTEPPEIAQAIVFLLENSMMNSFHVSTMKQVIPHSWSMGSVGKNIAQSRCRLENDYFLDTRSWS